MVAVNIVCLASCPESQHARTPDPVCCVYGVMLHATCLSHTLTFLLPSPPHLPPLLNTLACIATLRIAGRDSNVLLTDVSRWPMITRNNGFGSLYVTAISVTMFPSLNMRATGPCVLSVWCYVNRDLSLSHTDVPPPLSPTPSATVEYTCLHLHAPDHHGAGFQRAAD